MRMTSWTKQTAAVAALGAALWAAAPTAQAAPVAVTGPATYNLAFSATSNGALLQATGTLTINALSATTMQVAISLTNGTSAIGLNRLTAFGFEIDPGTVTGGTTPTASWGVAVNTNLPGVSNGIDVCAFDTNSCTSAGPGSQGIFEGTTESVILDLTGSFPTTFNITQVGVRFASVGTGNRGSIAFAGTISLPPTEGGGGPNQVEVPAPGALALFGLGLLGLGVAWRRRA